MWGCLWMCLFIVGGHSIMNPLSCTLPFSRLCMKNKKQYGAISAEASQHVSNTVSNIMSFSTPVLVSEILIYIVQSLCCHVRLLVILHTHCYIICQSHKINEQQVPSQWTGIRFTQRLALHKYLLHLLLVTNCQNRDLSGD